MASSALTKAHAAIAKMQSHVSALKGKGEEAVGQGLAAVEVAIGAGGMGFLNEKMGTDQDGIRQLMVHNVPASLLIGVVGKAAAFMRVAGKHSEHLHDLANGAIGSWASDLGRVAARKVGK